MRQVGVHLAQDVNRLGKHLLDAVDVRPAEAAAAGAVQNGDPPGVLECEPVGHLARSVGGVIVDNQDADLRLFHQLGDQNRQVRALVVRRYDHHGAGRHGLRPSNRREEICSETRPIRKMTTLSRMSSTDELVTWDCVAIVHRA
jgi:hypothetical protein